MTLLLLISSPFGALSYFVPRVWTIALPFAFWIGVAWFGELGILSGRTSLGSALVAGGFGAVFALIGLGLARQRRRLAAVRLGDTRER